MEIMRQKDQPSWSTLIFNGVKMSMLEIKESTKVLLKTIAEAKNISVSDFVEKLVDEYRKQNIIRPITPHVGVMKKDPLFKGDAVEIQKELRNEWD